MTGQNELTQIRRILVALDASLQSLSALDAAVNLAAALGAELEGLFVEDISLLRLAGLPFAREIRYLNARSEPLGEGDMEEQLQRQATRARQQLERKSQQRNVEASFRVVRGVVPREVLAAAYEADLLVLGWASHLLGARVRLGSTAVAALTQAPRPVLLMHPRGAANRSLTVVVYDGGEPAQRALYLARTLMPDDGRLHILIAAPSDEVAEAHQADLTAQLAEIKSSLSFGRVAAASAAESLEQALDESQQANAEIGLLVLGIGQLGLSQHALRELAARVDFPILVVR